MQCYNYNYINIEDPVIPKDNEFISYEKMLICAQKLGKVNEIKYYARPVEEIEQDLREIVKERLRKKARQEEIERSHHYTDALRLFGPGRPGGSTFLALSMATTRWENERNTEKEKKNVRIANSISTGSTMAL